MEDSEVGSVEKSGLAEDPGCVGEPGLTKESGLGCPVRLGPTEFPSLPLVFVQNFLSSPFPFFPPSPCPYSSSSRVGVRTYYQMNPYYIRSLTKD